MKPMRELAVASSHTTTPKRTPQLDISSESLCGQDEVAMGAFIGILEPGILHFLGLSSEHSGPAVHYRLNSACMEHILPARWLRRCVLYSTSRMVDCQLFERSDKRPRLPVTRPAGSGTGLSCANAAIIEKCH